ncbi:hypothetical protein RclHR1_10260010 [Rhizophagus clarus]|nr:hypothetical protein RclHR1_10260010 [Rhizophagus clarus]
MVALALGTAVHPDNPNPRVTSVSVGDPPNDRPHRGPYIGYWPSRVNYNAVRWYKISWNRYLEIGYNVRIDFNDILNQLTEDSDDDDEEDSDEDDEQDDGEDDREDDGEDDEDEDDDDDEDEDYEEI